MVFDAVLYPCHEILEIAFHLYRHIVWIEAAFVGIADDGRLAVIGGNDDETVSGVEDIESSFAFVRCIGG